MTNEHDNQGAREALVEQLAEAMERASTEGVTWQDLARAAVLPVVAAQVEAAVSVVRADLARHYEAHLADERRAYRALREGLEAALSERVTPTLATAHWAAETDEDYARVNPSWLRCIIDEARAVRALLAPSPAEGTGEADPIEVCGSSDHYLPLRPAPVVTPSTEETR